MKKVFILLFAIVLTTGLTLGQDVMPAAKTGSKSLNFTFGGLGTFGVAPTGPLGGIGVSYFLNSDAAVRAGLQLGIASTSTPASASPGTDGSTSSLTFGVAADYLMYMNAGRVRPYMGGGLLFQTQTSDVKPVLNGTGTQDEVKGGTPTTFGLRGIMGAEFFVYSELSFSAEYQLNLVSITSTSDLTHSNPSSTQKGGSATNILGFGGGGVTLHIYF
ncbi:MAG TPA: outer membrane beta-barrel protein [Bacteroidota bacterium]|nr:outer membrane beta-barrel protein [Bacteroidota bacterium]